MDTKHGFETIVVHAGAEPDPLTGAVMTPIYQTSTYAQSAPGTHKGYEYSRTDNPTRTALQRSLAALEGARHALVFGSGLAATDALLNTLQAGDHVVAGNDLYGGTYRLFTQVAANRGLKFSFIPLHDPSHLEAAITRDTKLIWFETPTNPLLNIVDIRQIVRLAKARGVLTALDNTFMSPCFQRAIEMGVDVVMHSLTKYINGHSDVVMGCLMLNDEALYGRLKFLQNAIGAVPAPLDCFLTLRGIKTLALRMERHASNALKVASWLETHPNVTRVLYPGLASHPQHSLAVAQTTGHSGMVTVFLAGGVEAARRFLSSLELFTLAESLGGVESLIEHPATMTHASVPREVREAIGLSDDLVRISVGIEDPNDLIADLDRALGRI